MIPRNDRFESKFEFLIKSEDRVSGTNSFAKFALPSPILGISGVQMKFFQTYNVIPSITSHNNYFETSSAIGGLTSVTFPPGHYVTDTGTVTIVEALVDPTTFTNDIRYYILRNPSIGGRFVSVGIDPVTGKLTVEMLAGLGNTYVTSATTATWMGFEPNQTPANPFSATNFLNLGGSKAIAISSNEFHNKGFVDTHIIPSNDFLDVVPVYSNFGDTLYYEPINPVQLLIRDAGRPLAYFTVRFVDPVTRYELPMTDWMMGLVFRSTSLIGY